MTLIRNVLVFAGSQPGNLAIFTKEAHDLGQSIAENKMRLIYGGGSIGGMGGVLNGVVGHGGVVTAIMPRFLFEKERPPQWLSKPPHEFIVTKDIPERIDQMFERADAIVSIPGGYGTGDEILAHLTDSKLGNRKKPHVIVNINGFFDPLFAYIDQIVKHEFGPRVPNLHVVNNAKQAIPKLLEVTATTNVTDLRAAG